MAVDTVKSQSILNLDQTPIQPITGGVGGPAFVSVVDDQAGATSTGMASTGSTYRIIRFPTGAIPKAIDFATDSYLDSHSTPALVLDLNIAFSDSTVDGTPAFLQGQVPTTSNTGSTTNFTSYSNPNIIFGQFTPTAAQEAIAYAPTNLVLNGSRTNYPMLNLFMQPLWQTFGFVDGRGNPADPGGFFDLVVYVSTVATTPHAANLYARITYVST